MGPASAGQWELRRRLVLLVCLVAVIGVAALGAMRVFTGVPLGVVTVGIVVVAVMVLWYVGRRQSDAVSGEKLEGYSTLYDFEGFELRDYRTQVVLRPRNVPPSGGIRRSLLSGMLVVTARSRLARGVVEDANRGSDADRNDER